MNADYHIHSEFSDDSEALLEAQVEAAISAGLDEICVTDHVDYGVKTDWDDPSPIAFAHGHWMANVHYPEYFAKIRRLRRIYAGKIRIKAGLEFGVQSHRIAENRALYETYREQMDFALCSIHEIDDTEFWTYDFQKGKTQEAYNHAYYEEMRKVVERFDGYSVLAHVDLIARYDPAGVYPFRKIRPYLEKIFAHIIRKGKGIELNTSSWRYKLEDTTPSRDILRLYREMGGRILTIGSDAHAPDRIGEHLDRARRILRDEIGFKEYCTFTHWEPEFHPL